MFGIGIEWWILYILIGAVLAIHAVIRTAYQGWGLQAIESDLSKIEGLLYNIYTDAIPRLSSEINDIHSNFDTMESLIPDTRKLEFERGFPIRLKTHFRLLQPVIDGRKLTIGVIVGKLGDL